MTEKLKEETRKDCKADFILANPPFNLKDWGGDKLTDDVRWKYGIPPAGNANFAWLQHMMHPLSPTGRYVGIAEAEDDSEPFEGKMTRLTTELSDFCSIAPNRGRNSQTIKNFGYELK